MVAVSFQSECEIENVNEVERRNAGEVKVEAEPEQNTSDTNTGSVVLKGEAKREFLKAVLAEIQSRKASLSKEIEEAEEDLKQVK